MRRLSRTPLRIGAIVAGVALCAVVAVLVATGTFTGGAKHARFTAEQRAHRAQLQAEQSAKRAVRAEIAHRRAEMRAAIRAAKSRALRCSRLGANCGTTWGDRYRGTANLAEKYLGVPYVWGGASPRVGFDSPGLVMYVYKQFGVSLPHYTLLQYYYRDAVHPSRSRLRAGDLVFFNSREHVGIYVGNNEFIHVPHTGTVVTIDSLTGSYARGYDGATRILS